MPYQPGSGSQKDSNLPAVQDVFKSTNVYINNVPVALWLTPNQSASFANVPDSPSVTIDSGIQTSLNAASAAYVANPGASFNKNAQDNGVKGNFAGTPNGGDGTISTTDKSDTSTANSNAIPAITETSASDIVPFLERCLSEASRNMWRETGQNGKPSNPNIVGIWKSLGYPSSGMWTTDQTPWCMGFINFGLKCSGYKFLQTAWAYDIRDKISKYGGTKVNNSDAQPGDVALWSFGHVSFVYKKIGNNYSFVGGNQTPTSGSNNNPNDGDVTISWRNGCPPTNSTWVGTFRIPKG